MGRYLLVSGDFVKTGGMDRANHALAAYLAARGDEVHLAAYRAADDLLGRPNVTLHRSAKPLNSYLLGDSVLRRVGRHAAKQLAVGGVRVVVNGGNCDWPDVNWVHHVNAADRPPPPPSILRRLKEDLAYRVFVGADNRVIPKAKTIVTTCGLTRRSILERIPGVREERIHIVYLGVDPSIFYPAGSDERTATRDRLGWEANRPFAMFIGSLGNRRKGFDVLFSAWETLCREPSWDADLVVVGAGSELPYWRERTEVAGLSNRIRLLGSRRDLPEILRAADGHVLPSRYEGYSMVTHEALCCGLPALVTASAGIAERYPDEIRDELLIPDPEDVADLIARLRRWRERIGQPWEALASFSERLRSYTWEDMAGQIATLIEQGA